MAETVANFQFCSEVLRDYFYDISQKILLKERIDNFYSERMKNILNLGRATLNRCLDYRPLISGAFYGVLSELKIKDCRYGETYFEALDNSNYYEYIRENIKNGACIIERGESTRESMLEGVKALLLSMDCSGVLLQMQGEEVLLLKIDAICNQIREKIEANADKWYIKYYDSDYTEEKILGNLMMEQWIYTHKRDDGCFDKIIKYPQYGIGEDEDGNFKTYLKKLHRVVRINSKGKLDTMHFDMLSIETIRKELPTIRKWQFHMGAIERKKITEDLEKVLKEMNKLIDLK